MLNWAEEASRQWVIEHGAAVELCISLAANTDPPAVFLWPPIRAHADELVDELADLERVLMAMLLSGPWQAMAEQCVRAGLSFQWRCRLAHLARVCTNWPHDVTPRVYASADKALTIELNKRKHAAAPSGTETAQVGLELAGAGLDLALKKLRVASELITELRAVFESERARDGVGVPPATAAWHQRINELLAQWDKLKGK